MASVPGKPSSARPEIAKSPLPRKPPGSPTEVVDLELESRQLRSEQAYEKHGQSAKTLVKHEHFRVVLIALKAGRRCQEHQAEESVSAQTVSGEVNVHLESGEAVVLPTGKLLALEPMLAHDFEAVTDSTLLLTMAWTGHREHAH